VPPFKNKSKPARKSDKSEQDSAISLFKSGTRNLFIPLWQAQAVYFNHPLKRTSVRVPTQFGRNDEFYAHGPHWDGMVAEVKTLGLLPRMAEELDSLALSVYADADKWKAIAVAFRLAHAADLPTKKDENED